MKNYSEKVRKNGREGGSVKILKRFFGALLFLLAVFFRDVYVKLPGYTGLALALVYFLAQYWLWIGGNNGNEGGAALKNR